jgi:hypothetical protein
MAAKWKVPVGVVASVAMGWFSQRVLAPTAASAQDRKDLHSKITYLGSELAVSESMRIELENTLAELNEPKRHDIPAASSPMAAQLERAVGVLTSREVRAKCILDFVDPTLVF